MHVRLANHVSKMEGKHVLIGLPFGMPSIARQSGALKDQVRGFLKEDLRFM